MACTSGALNPFEEYSEEIAKTILNINQDLISPEFESKLDSFISEKLEKLTNVMENDIFYDNNIYTGATGVALLFLKRAIRQGSMQIDELMKCIKYLNLDKLKTKRISFLCGDAGPLAIAAIVSYKLGSRRPEKLPEYKVIAKRLMNLVSLLDDSPDELLYGKSGYLYALMFVNKHIGKEVIPSDLMDKVVQAILQSGKHFSHKMKSESPLLWQWHDKIYIGGAHGVAGILYILIQARAFIGPTEMRNLVWPTLNWVLGLQFPSGNFPSSLGSNSGDRLVQWCHGAPGFIPLFILAHQVFGDKKYLEKAIQCGEVVWQRGLSNKGYSLCHGVSGNAYTFIRLYQATKEPKHLYRACCFTEWCVQQRAGSELRQPDRPSSLFEGLTGRLYLAEDMLNIEQAAFPAYTV